MICAMQAVNRGKNGNERQRTAVFRRFFAAFERRRRLALFVLKLLP